MRFIASEKYRKYLIGLNFRDFNVFTVWGTDMEDGEDKLLIIDEKLMVFKNPINVKSVLQTLTSPFLDEGNIMCWINEENLNHTYNENNMTLLYYFRIELLNDKKASLTILNCLNLIQDFAIQVNHIGLMSIFDHVVLECLKNYIYNNYFWKGEGRNIAELFESENKIKKLCESLYSEFFESLTVI